MYGVFVITRPREARESYLFIFLIVGYLFGDDDGCPWLLPKQTGPAQNAWMARTVKGTSLQG